MDAITSAALDNLNRDALPRLQVAIAKLAAMPVDAREITPDIAALLKEAVELMSLLHQSSGEESEMVIAGAEGVAIAGADAVTDINDEDAQALLAGMSEPVVSDMSDADAQALLADMDKPAKQGSLSSNDMSDAEAQALLVDMDKPVRKNTGSSHEISDAEAQALLADMDKPIAQNTASDEMSDAEAQALLADMDKPVAKTSGDLSDEDARRLLAEMDAPTPSNASEEIQIASADDEAMAMLKAMGGMEDDATPVLVAATQKMQASGEVDTSGIEEIPEWENNDFASDPDMMNDFNQNTSEIMQTLDDTVLRLEQNPTDKETIEEIFRAAHTLKGAAGMFGFKAIERVMHRMENLFDLVRKGKLVPKSDTIDVVFQGLDVLKKLLAAVHAGKPSGTKTAPIVRMLELAAEGKATGVKRGAGGDTPKDSAPAPTQEGGDQHHAGGGGDQAGGASKKKSEAASTIRVDLERLDALVNLVGELVIDRTRFVNIEESLRVQAPQLKLASAMTETLQQFGRHMNEIQDIIMKVRMVPVGSVFNKYPRIVRDLARQLGKQIDLVVVGEETEFDKTLVEQIADPLVHLIRNACDHGIEMPDDRVKSGKSANGTVTLSANQEGNHIVIQISDDGKGMDVTRIRAKGIEKGLITAEQNLSDRDIFNLIFEPGFSTAEKVTTVSGRGVGMDVVKKQISKLKGVVEIMSTPGKGSTITIQLPLTLAIMQSLLVGTGEEVFAVPLSSVVESIRIKPSEIQYVGEAQVIKLRNTVLPLLYLDEVLDLQKKDQNYWYRHPDQTLTMQIATKRRARRNERLFVVVVGTGDRRFGLVVDALLNQQEMVIKPMGPLMHGTPCVAGGAVMGNGDVVLVLDVPEMESFYRTKLREAAQAAA